MTTKVKKMRTREEPRYGIETLEKRFGPMTFAMFLKAFRECDEASQSEYARKLGISRANLCDLEKGRKMPSPERAASIARILGVGETTLIRLAIQDSLRAANFNYEVELKIA